MRNSLLTLAFCCFAIGLSPVIHASEFDQYLQEKKIIDQEFKIIDKETLNEVLSVLSAEDSKTLPIQIDQNTIIEQFNLSADQTILKGLITTPDFEQFEAELGHKEVLNVIRNHLLNNCPIFFEHEYQRRNPYLIQLQLSSTTESYQLNIKQKDCGF